MTNRLYDIMIIGSGFAGSLTAMILKKKGFDVVVIEREKHPRFSVGESSTPIADMILRDFAHRYELPFLQKISRYGSWQEHYPDVICGLKRGFSYFPHQKKRAFWSDENHINELLVAASEDDDHSDTNWLRSDVDHFFVKEAQKIGVPFHENTHVDNLSRHNRVWSAQSVIEGVKETIKAKWIIDATGGASFSNRFFGTNNSTELFETHSGAIFSHVEHAGKWLDYLHINRFITSNYPYHPDESALHHIIDEGWIWMLRFNTDLLSAGLVVDLSEYEFDQKDGDQLWEEIVSNYPSIHNIFSESSLAGVPGKFIKTGRLQRKLDQTYGDGWLALHHTSGFVDPLHSTGIAFTLSGVEKITGIFDPAQKMDQLTDKLGKIQNQFEEELFFIDKLVACCYKSRWYFPLFSAAVMLYFIASVRYEQSRLRGDIPDTFLCAGDKDMKDVVDEIFYEIRIVHQTKSQERADYLIKTIKEKIRPFNSVGLMDPAAKNMYRHTAVDIG